MHRGDAVYQVVYAKNNKIESLKVAYQNLTNKSSYLKFSSNVTIDGIWDGSYNNNLTIVIIIKNYSNNLYNNSYKNYSNNFYNNFYSRKNKQKYYLMFLFDTNSLQLLNKLLLFL